MSVLHMLTRARAKKDGTGLTPNPLRVYDGFTGLISSGWLKTFSVAMCTAEGPLPRASGQSRWSHAYEKETSARLMREDHKVCRRKFKLNMDPRMERIVVFPDRHVQIHEMAFKFVPSILRSTQEGIMAALEGAYPILTPTYLPAVYSCSVGTHSLIVPFSGAFVSVQLEKEDVDTVHGSIYTLTRKVFPNEREAVKMVSQEINMQHGIAFHMLKETERPPLVWRLHLKPDKMWARHAKAQAFLVAVFMGQHSRLGAQSPLLGLDPFLLRIIAQMGVSEMTLNLREVEELLLLSPRLECESIKW